MIHHNHPKSIVTLHFSLGIVQSMGLIKCIITYIHHYNITHRIFTVLKNSLYSTYLSYHHPLPTHSTAGNSRYFHCPHNFVFPACHIVEIVQYVAFFIERLFSPSKVHFRCPHVFPCLNRSFMFRTE